MLQTKESIRLLPEQKTFLLPSGRYKADSLENMNDTLIRASDAMDESYKQLYQSVSHLTDLDDECSVYHGDMQLNIDIITAATIVDSCLKRIDQKILDANPSIEKYGDGDNDD